MHRTASPSFAAASAETEVGAVHRTERGMTAADRSLQRRTGYRCHSAPSCSVAQAWVSGGAKVDDDRKLRVPGGGGGGRQVDVLGAAFLLDGNVHWLIRGADPGSLCQPLWALGHLPGRSPSRRAFQ